MMSTDRFPALSAVIPAAARHKSKRIRSSKKYLIGGNIFLGLPPSAVK
jgi:hypothetical protein